MVFHYIYRLNELKFDTSETFSVINLKKIRIIVEIDFTVVAIGKFTSAVS